MFFFFLQPSGRPASALILSFDDLAVLALQEALAVEGVDLGVVLLDVVAVELGRVGLEGLVVAYGIVMLL